MTDDFLVLGGGGFVGRELVNHFRCPGTNTTGSGGFIRCDATVAGDVKSVIEHLRPRFVINCVGLADVDRAEAEPQLAAGLNETAVKNIASVARDLHFKLVQISTDYVFDGSKGNYTENDATGPVNTYGMTKLAGEAAASQVRDSLIVRISTPYGEERGRRRRQFFSYVVDVLKESGEVKAVADQFVTSTYLPDLAGALDRLCHRGCSGIYHVTSRDRMSRYEFARLVAETSGLDVRLITMASTGGMRWKARRPRDSSLSVAKSLSEGVAYTPARDAVAWLLSKSRVQNAGGSGT